MSRDVTNDRVAAETEPTNPGLPAEGQRAEPSPKAAWHFWAHAAGLAALLLILLPIIDNGYVAFPDEGVYSLQAQNLADGSWSSPRPAPDVDAEGLFDAIGPTAVIGDESIPYGRHPLYPLLLGGAYWIGGATALLVVSVGGTLMAAVAAGLLARRLNRRFAIPALWLTGVGSPLLFSAYLVMGHSLAAGLCGLMILALTRALDDDRLWPLPLGLIAAALLVNVRSEGVLIVAAAGAAIGLMALPIPRRRPVDWRSGLIAASLLATGLLAFLMDTWASRRVLQLSDFGSAPLENVLSERTGPLDAAWISLFRPWHTDLQAQVPNLLVLLCLALGLIALRVVPNRPVLPLGLFGLAAVSAMWALFSEPGLISGLFAAFPIAVAALIFFKRPPKDQPLVARLALTLVLSLALIMLAIYGDGGATQWGGRFFNVLIPLLVPLVILGLFNARQQLSHREALFAGSCLMVVTLSMGTLSLRANSDARHFMESLVVGSLDALPTTGTGTTPLLITAQIGSDGTARAFWTEREEVEVLRSGDIRNTFVLVNDAALAGRESAFVLSGLDPERLQFFEQDRLDESGWSQQGAVALDGNGYFLVEYGPDDSDG